MLDLAVALAQTARLAHRPGHGVGVEGPWPYAPVLEALSELCRNHPALLDGLDDVYRLEIERALSGRDVSWSGESSAPAVVRRGCRAVRLAAAGHGLLLAVDDLHEADEASLRLLHYLSRCAVSEPVVIAVAYRPSATLPAREVLDSLVTRAIGTRIELAPLTESSTMRLLADRYPDLPAETARHIWQVSAGLPFTVLEMARGHGSGAAGVLPVLPGTALGTWQRVALLGSTFSTDELLAVAGTSEDEAYQHLEAGLTALMIEPAESGYRFRHALVREALLEQMPPYVESAARREVAERLSELDAPPGRVAHQFLAAGLAVAGSALRASSRRDGGCARRLSGCAHPCRHGAGARRTRRAAAASRPAR